jgi:rSAM/selenodomain-associated transferase 1
MRSAINAQASEDVATSTIKGMFPTTLRPRQKLLVFARLPELGRVKTRIAAELGHERTLTIYEAMLADLLERVGDSDERIEVEIMWTASPDATGEDLRRVFGPRRLAMQTGATLGDRMSIAFSERVFFHDASKVMAIGTDEPGVDRAFIECAFRLLDSCDWVVGPASDGGYYLLGCRAADFFPEIFQDIEWSSDKVLQATLDRIRDKGQTIAVLPTRSDIDFVEDLRSFAGSCDGGRLAGLLDEWGWTQ